MSSQRLEFLSENFVRVSKKILINVKLFPFKFKTTIQQLYSESWNDTLTTLQYKSIIIAKASKLLILKFNFILPIKFKFYKAV